MRVFCLWDYWSLAGFKVASDMWAGAKLGLRLMSTQGPRDARFHLLWLVTWWWWTRNTWKPVSCSWACQCIPAIESHCSVKEEENRINFPDDQFFFWVIRIFMISTNKTFKKPYPCYDTICVCTLKQQILPWKHKLILIISKPNNLV